MKWLFTFWLSFLFCSFGFAQKFSTSINAQLAIPQGEYQTANSDAGFGLRANILYRPSTAPVKLGLELGLMEKGRATQYFSSYQNGYYDEFKVSATSNIFSLLFLARFQSPNFRKVRPFVDVTGGWNVFFSTVNVERLTYYNPYNDSYSNSSKAKWSLAFGLAGGADIPLNKSGDIGLELKLAYLAGTNTRYLSDPHIDNTANVSFVEKESRTDMLIPQAGIRITIK